MYFRPVLGRNGAISLLRYLSLNQPFVVFVIMVKAMMVEFWAFILLYLIELAGVIIGLRGLFYGQNGNGSNVKTLLTVFSATNSFRFNKYATSSNVVNGIGILILVGVLIMVPLVLINLLIAQMTNSYQTVKDNSTRECATRRETLTVNSASSFQYLVSVSEYLRLCG
jgi:hypothetical protein